MKLSSKGLIIAALPLSMGAISTCTLLYQFAQAKMEADSEQLVRQIYDAGNRLVLGEFKAGQTLVLFAATREPAILESYNSSCREVDASCLELDRLTVKFPDMHRRVARIVDLTRELVATANSSRLQGDGAELAPLETFDLRTKLQDQFIEQGRESTALRQACRQLLDKSKKGGERNWRATVFTTISAVLLTVLASVAVSITITRNIIRRLIVLADNSGRLTSGQELLPPVAGNDEIADLDRQFHSMAEALKSAHEKEKVITERMPAALILLNQDGFIIRVNSKAQGLLAHAETALIGKPLTEFLQQGEAKIAPERMFQSLLQRTEGKLVETEICLKEAKQLIVELSIDRLESRSETTFVAIMLDVTDRYEAQARREKLAAMIAHDIRTPLCGIDVNLQVILDGLFGDLHEQVARRLQQSRTGTQRVVRLLNDLLRLTRQQATRLTLEMEEISADGIVGEAVDSVSASAAAKGIVVEQAIASLPATLFADRDKLIQVVLNLLSNATKFSPDNGKITVYQQVESDKLRISVVDQGPGIPAGMEESIFMPFKQVSWKDAAEKDGTGLGLSICKMIIEDHGGEIGVSSKPGQGANFWFTVPLSKY